MIAAFILGGAHAVTGSPRPDGTPAAAGSEAAGPPFDVQAVVRRIHFGFRPVGSGFVGGHSTYAVEADARQLRVSAVRTPRAADPRTDDPRPAVVAMAPTVGAPLILETAVLRGAPQSGPDQPPTIDDEGRVLRLGPAVTETIANTAEGVALSWTFPARPEGQDNLEVRVAASGLQYAGETPEGHHFREPASPVGLRFGHATWIDAAGIRTEVPARWTGSGFVMTVPARTLDESSYPAVLDPIIGPETAVDAPVTGVASGYQMFPFTAYDPGTGTYLVAWSDGRSSAATQAFATRVDAAGTVLDPAGILVDVPVPYSSPAAVIFDGTNFLVVVQTPCRTFGQRISPAGTLVDAAAFAIGQTAVCQGAASASTNGTTTLVAWEDHRNHPVSGTDIYGARVAGGIVLDEPAFPISTANTDQLRPRIASAGSNWIVVWEDLRNGDKDVFAARVAGSGVVLDPPVTGLAVSALPGSGQWEPWPASDGSDYFVAWRDDRNWSTTRFDAYGARVTAAGSVLDPAGIQLCNHDNDQYNPSVAFGGGNYQVVWQDFRGPGLFANRVSPSTGAILDGPAGSEITGVTKLAFVPTIFATGSGFYVGWYSYQGDRGDPDIQGSRLTTAPVLLDAPGTDLAFSANGQKDVAIAGDGTNYLVAWEDDRGGEKAIYAARIDGTTGLSLDPAGILLSSGGSHESHPAVAFNGSQYLVAWGDLRFPRGIWGTRVTTGGTVVDPAGIGLFTTATGNASSLPDITSDGADWFLVWSDTRNIATTGWDIYGGRVAATGTVLDPAGFPVSTAPGNQSDPRVTFGGGYYFASWSHYLATFDLYGARVSPSGVLQDPAGILIGTDVYQTGYAVAYGGSNFVVAYTSGPPGLAKLNRALIPASTGIVADTSELVALSPNAPPRTAMAFGSNTFTVIYDAQAQTPFGRHIKGTRMDAAGTDVDPVDWDLVPGGTRLGFAEIAIAARGSGTSEFLAGYTRYDSTPGVTADRAWTRRILGGVEADLSVTKTDSQTTAAPGQVLTYAIQVANSGPDDVSGVNIVDTFPGEILGPTWTCAPSAGSSCTPSGSGNINDFVNLLAGGTVTYSATGTVSPGAVGSLSNTATITTSDSDPTNNSATDIDAIVAATDLAITKTDSADPVSPGDPLVYVLTVTNNGPSDATSVSVVDTLPAGVTFVSSLPGPPTCALAGVTLTCDLGPLAAGASAIVTINVTVDTGASGIQVNTATVSGSESDPDPGNNSASAATAVGPKDGELTHGTDEVFDLAALPGPVADEDVFRIEQKPYSSYEVVVDATSGDIGAGSGPLVERMAADGTTVLQTSSAVGAGPSRSLRWRNSTAVEVEGESIRVRSATCATDCGPDDIYRIRAYETTYSIPRFNNAGTQVTVLVVQNPTNHPISGEVHFRLATGALAASESFSVGPKATLILNTTTVPGASGVSGALTVAHDGRYGDLSGKTVALEPATGFSFDSPMVPRPK
jgi:uncharacterized repeat protein (TIGR01451 family)